MRKPSEGARAESYDETDPYRNIATVRSSHAHENCPNQNRKKGGKPYASCQGHSVPCKVCDLAAKQHLDLFGFSNRLFLHCYTQIVCVPRPLPGRVQWHWIWQFSFITRKEPGLVQFVKGHHLGSVHDPICRVIVVRTGMTALRKVVWNASS